MYIRQNRHYQFKNCTFECQAEKMFIIFGEFSSVVFEGCQFICSGEVTHPDRSIIQVNETGSFTNNSMIVLKDVEIVNNITEADHAAHGLHLLYWRANLGYNSKVSFDNVTLSAGSHALKHVVKFVISNVDNK